MRGGEETGWEWLLCCRRGTGGGGVSSFRRGPVEGGREKGGRVGSTSSREGRGGGIVGVETLLR